MRLNVFRRIPVIGVEDGSFKKGITKKAKLVAVLFLETRIEDVRVAEVTVDGMDTTEVLAKMIGRWHFGAILLSGISFAGFNVIDPAVIYEKYRKPLIVISKTRPNNVAVKRALMKHFEDWEKRWSIFERLGEVCEIQVVKGAESIYIETIGETSEWARSIVRAFSFFGRMPEPLRAARLIARGIS